MNRLVIVALFGLVAVAVARPCGPKPTPAGRQGGDDGHECPWKAEGLRQLGKYFQGKELETVYEHVEGFALQGGCPMPPMGEEPPTREEVEEGVKACLEAAHDYFKANIDDYPVLKAIFEKHADASCGGHDEDDGEEEARCGEESDEARDDDESDEARCGEESDEARDDSDDSDEARCGGYDVESDEARSGSSEESDEARCGGYGEEEESDEARDDSDDSDEARCGEESDEARDDDETEDAGSDDESEDAGSDDESEDAGSNDESEDAGSDDESEDAGSNDENAEERCGGSPPPRRAGSPPPRRQ